MQHISGRLPEAVGLLVADHLPLAALLGRGVALRLALGFQARDRPVEGPAPDRPVALLGDLVGIDLFHRIAPAVAHHVEAQVEEVLIRGETQIGRDERWWSRPDST